MKRHFGKIKNNDQKIVLVFPQIPGRDDHALVLSTDNLNPRLEQAIMEIVESREGQAETVLGAVLNRRVLPESGKNVLQALHEANLLRPIPVDQVLMLPLPNMPFPLRQIIEDSGGIVSGPRPAVEEKYNPHAVNTDAMDHQTRIGIANNLLYEAKMLEEEMIAKRERAYAHAPELRPKTVSSVKAATLTEGAPVEIAVTDAAKTARKAPAKSKATKKAAE